MIKSETIRMKVSSALKQNYANLGYDFSREEIDFKVSDLKEVSNQKVDVICDICKNEYNLHYCKYVKNVKRNGLYSCKECGLKKRSDMMKSDNLSLNKDYQEKKRRTFIENYGVDNPSKSEIIKEKKRRTCMKNYGVDCGLKLKDKVKNGMKEKYGVEHALKSEIIKDKMYFSLVDKYGVDNVSKLQNVKVKKEETCMRNHGVRYPSQNKLIFKKQLLSSYKIAYYNDELFSQGSYELDFLNYCDSNGIIGMISNGPSLEYKLNEEYYIYHSDFYIEKYNLIIEVKSTYTYNYNLDKNLAKEKYSKLNGYNFLFIIDKNYTSLSDIIKKEKSV